MQMGVGRKAKFAGDQMCHKLEASTVQTWNRALIPLKNPAIGQD
jgi:hypothetical protein